MKTAYKYMLVALETERDHSLMINFVGRNSGMVGILEMNDAKFTALQGLLSVLDTVAEKEVQIDPKAKA